MTETLNTLRYAEQKYADLCEKRAAAYKLYQVEVDAFYAHRISRDQLNEVFAKATKFDDACALAYAELNQAKVLHLEYLASQEQECECTPVSTCEPCAQRARNSEIQY